MSGFSPTSSKEQKKRFKPSGTSSSAKQHRRESPKFVVKPHRRLRALSAEKNLMPSASMDDSDDENGGGGGGGSGENTVWVGMRDYKAATHKVALSRAFRMKLPALNRPLSPSSQRSGSQPE